MFKQGSSSSTLVPACRCLRRGSERRRQAHTPRFDPMSGTWLMVAVDVAWVTSLTLACWLAVSAVVEGAAVRRSVRRSRPGPVRLHRGGAALLPVRQRDSPTRKQLLGAESERREFESRLGRALDMAAHQCCCDRRRGGRKITPSAGENRRSPTRAGPTCSRRQHGPHRTRRGLSLRGRHADRMPSRAVRPRRAPRGQPAPGCVPSASWTGARPAVSAVRTDQRRRIHCGRAPSRARRRRTVPRPRDRRAHHRGEHDGLTDRARDRDGAEPTPGEHRSADRAAEPAQPGERGAQPGPAGRADRCGARGSRPLQAAQRHPRPRRRRSSTANICSGAASCVRDHDLVCRYGGEEFIVVCPDSDKHGASLVFVGYGWSWRPRSPTAAPRRSRCRPGSPTAATPTSSPT